MKNVIDVVKKLFEDLAVNLGIPTDILLYALLGLLVLLLIILMLVGRKPRKAKGSADGSGFLEVGPEPVIVYGRGKKFEDSEPAPEPEPDFRLSGEEDGDSFDFRAEPEQLTPSPEAQSLADPRLDLPEEAVESPPDLGPSFMAQARREPPALEFPPEPEPRSLTPLAAEPSPAAPVSPFQLFMDADPGQEAAAAFQPALAREPLPHLESDFAGDILLLFSKQGFTIEKVPYHGTYGADFIVSSPGMKAYVQVKDWKKKATPRTVQEARYYANTNGCHKTFLIPLAGYTTAAGREAAQRAVYLLDGRTLKKIKSGELSLEEWIASASF